MKYSLYLNCDHKLVYTLIMFLLYTKTHKYDFFAPCALPTARKHAVDIYDFVQQVVLEWRVGIHSSQTNCLPSLVYLLERAYCLALLFLHMTKLKRNCSGLLDENF